MHKSGDYFLLDKHTEHNLRGKELVLQSVDVLEMLGHLFKLKKCAENCTYTAAFKMFGGELSMVGICQLLT